MGGLPCWAWLTIVACPPEVGYPPLPVNTRGNEKPDIDALLAEIRARVESRRRSGFYPPDLEEHLSEHFRRVVNFRARDLSKVRSRLVELRARGHFQIDQIPAESKLPGGSLLHKMIAKVIGRQIQGALDQVHQYAQTVWGALEEIAAILEEPTSEEAYKLGLADSLLERLTDQERLLRDLRNEVRQLQARLDNLQTPL